MVLLAHLGVPKGKDLMGKALGNYVWRRFGRLQERGGAGGDRSGVSSGDGAGGGHDGRQALGKAGPFRLVVSEDKRPARSVRNLVRVEVKMAE